jgi:sugar phosphate isomerase/epimerase
MSVPTEQRKAEMEDSGISRRSVLYGAAAVVAGTLWGGVTLVWGADASSKPGVQMYMVLEEYQKDPAGTLAKLHSIGYGYLEAFAMPMVISDLAEFKRMVGDAGLECPSGHFAFGFFPPEKLLDDAGRLGVHYVVGSVMPTPTDLSKDDDLKHGDPKAITQMFNNRTADDFKRMAAQANEIGESAKKRGLEFAYHNHNVEFRKIEGGTTGYEILVNETDPTLVKLEVDAGWMAVGGADPAALITANASRVKLMHLKDFGTISPPINELDGKAEARIVDLGTGVAPLKAAYKAARNAGTKCFIVDHDPPFHGKTALETAKVDYAYMARLMGR